LARNHGYALSKRIWHLIRDFRKVLPSFWYAPFHSSATGCRSFEPWCYAKTLCVLLWLYQ